MFSQFTSRLSMFGAKPKSQLDNNCSIRTDLYSKETTSSIVEANGPTSAEQLQALANGNYWTILNSHILSLVGSDDLFASRTNALKHSLQTWGPNSDRLPDLRNNTGKVKGTMYHGHINNSNGSTYVLEWAIIDKSKQFLALIGFDTHENYKFRKQPLTRYETAKIVNSKKNKKVIANATQKIDEAKDKVERVENNYRNC